MPPPVRAVRRDDGSNLTTSISSEIGGQYWWDRLLFETICEQNPETARLHRLC